MKNIRPLWRVVDKDPLFESREIALAEWIAGFYLCSCGQALSTMLPSGRRPTSSPSMNTNEITDSPLTLSGEQKQALIALTAPDPDFLPLYLYGVTGSGKTEVFLQAAEFVMQAGKTVIYLVPEITLTYQTAEVIRRRFGDTAATLHSGMTGSERLAEWMRIRRGEARIVIGPRSAVFAPVRNLGLIIIDEEHDGSYKAGNTPRYHARQVAMHRCQIEKASIVMGSATPSVEAWKLMKEGKFRRFDLTRRLSGGDTPRIRMLSLAQTTGCLTTILKEEIRVTALMGKQTILFLNRRGFAYCYRCPACGYELTCKHCSVSLTYHKSRNRAVCHYCGYETEAPRVCPQCGSLDASYAGFGTEMIEEEVRRTFPDLRISRLDADTKKGSIQKTLDLFRLGAIDILLGTQMVAKGLNFPGVRLVGIVFADSGLHLPDFRAAERTFSLLVQVAGRSGRFSPDGIVIVQTLRPNDLAIQKACALDAEGFFDAELNQRNATGFPPFSRIIRFTARSKDEQKAGQALAKITQIAADLLPPDADVLGPAECPIAMIAGNYRRHILFRGKTMKTLHNAVRSIISRYEEHREPKVYLEIDVDPVSIM
ncbi:primosomal protein N' [Spirochaetia bacterium]|nr:primosomal protein N' [Spirochaetia bacterium]